MTSGSTETEFDVGSDGNLPEGRYMVSTDPDSGLPQQFGPSQSNTGGLPFFDASSDPTSDLSPAELQNLENLIADSSVLVGDLQDFIDKDGAVHYNPKANDGSGYAKRDDKNDNDPGITLDTVSKASGPTVDPFAPADGNNMKSGGNYAGVLDGEVGYIVGTLAHEIGHFEDSFGLFKDSTGAQIDPANPYFELQQSDIQNDDANHSKFYQARTVLGLLSEGRAQYNNIQVADQIATTTSNGGTALPTIISLDIGGPTDNQTNLAAAYANPSGNAALREQAVLFLGGEYSLNDVSVSNTPETYLEYYSNNADWSKNAVNACR